MKLGLAVCGMLIAGCGIVVPAQSAPQGPRPEISSVLTERLKAISGGKAIDCGTTSFTIADAAVSACGQKSYQDSKPFFLSYIRSGGVLASGYGLARDVTGNVFAVNYQGFRPFPAVAPNRHTKLADNNHTRIIECIKPITLGKTEAGILTCITPVNHEESDKVAHQKPVDTTICAILENPSTWNNRLVRVRGHYSGNFEYSMLSGDGCNDALWFAYGGGGAPPSLSAHVGGGASPGAEDAEGRFILPVPITLVRNLKFSHFETQVEQMAKADDESYKKNPDKFVDRCVTATFTGRLDAVSAEVHKFRKLHPPREQSDFLGFGQMGLFESEFVLETVNDDAVLGVCKD
jgi:hypothetical protein